MIADKPDNKIFASQAQSGELENFPDVDRGWGIAFEKTEGIPPMEWFNYLQNRTDKNLLYLAQRGIAEYQSEMTYPIHALVQYEGKVYKASQTAKDKQPNATLGEYWQEWGVNTSELENYLQKSSKSSSLTSSSEDTIATSKAVKAVFDETKKAMLDATTQQYTAGSLDLNGRSQVYRVNNASAFGAYNWGVGLALRTGTGNTGFADLYIPHTANKVPELWIRNGYNGGHHSQWGKLQPLPPITSEVNDASQEKLASALAVKKAYERAVSAEGKGLPVGAMVTFPDAVSSPNGFLRCDGQTFEQSMYPDLYRALGNRNKLPNLNGEVGQLAYFATHEIPTGWVAFDEIRTTVTQGDYPELYRLLVAQYSRIEHVPLSEDRFIRGLGESLTIGQTQEDEIKKHGHQLFSHYPTASDWASLGYRNTGNYQNIERVHTNTDGHATDNAWIEPYGNSPSLTGGLENRPKSIAFKLCIKAKNNSVCWIKAYGAVVNAGSLDVSRVEQSMNNIQQNLQQQISGVNEDLKTVSTALFWDSLGESQTLKKVFDGSVYGTGAIGLSESVADSFITIVFTAGGYDSLEAGRSNSFYFTTYIPPFSNHSGSYPVTVVAGDEKGVRYDNGNCLPIEIHYTTPTKLTINGATTWYVRRVYKHTKAGGWQSVNESVNAIRTLAKKHNASLEIPRGYFQ